MYLHSNYLHHLHQQCIQTVSFTLHPQWFSLFGKLVNTIKGRGLIFQNGMSTQINFSLTWSWSTIGIFSIGVITASSAIPLRGGLNLSVTWKVVGPTSISKLMVGIDLYRDFWDCPASIHVYVSSISKNRFQLKHCHVGALLRLSSATCSDDERWFAERDYWGIPSFARCHGA